MTTLIIGLNFVLPGKEYWSGSLSPAAKDVAPAVLSAVRAEISRCASHNPCVRLPPVFQGVRLH